MAYNYYSSPLYHAPYGMYRYKQAAQPPMDPAMMGGAPPMDPAMMGGAPPMDPAMMGGAPPMGPPPMDPGMMGAPPIDPAAAGLPPAAPPPPPAPAPGAPAPGPEGEKKGGKTQKIDDVMAKIQKCLYALQVQVALIMKSLNISIPPEVLVESSNPEGPDISNPTPNLLDLGDVAGLEGQGGSDIDINPPMGGEMPKEGSWNGPIINLLRRNLGIADVLNSSY